MTKRAKRITIGLIGVAVLAGFAIPKLTSSSDKPAAASSSRRGGGGPLAVRAYVVAPATLDDRILVTGTISPNEQVDLQSEVPGKITRILFNEGQVVSKGTLLVKINDADLQAQLKRALLQKQLAEVKEGRQRQLRDKQAISAAEYDIAQNELNTSDAEIGLIRAQIAKTEIRAPFSGVIGLRYISEGSYVAPTTKIASLHSINPVKIDFSVPEKYYSLVRRGSEIGFRVQGSPDKYVGTVYAVEPRIDQSTRTLQVRAISRNTNGDVFPGSFAEIDLILKSENDALLIPTEALIPELNGASVFVSKGGKAESRKVEIGTRTATSVQIMGGLTPGDTVITTGILQMRPGNPLKITEFQKL